MMYCTFIIVGWIILVSSKDIPNDLEKFTHNLVEQLDDFYNFTTIIIFLPTHFVLEIPQKPIIILNNQLLSKRPLIQSINKKSLILGFVDEIEDDQRFLMENFKGLHQLYSIFVITSNSSVFDDQHFLRYNPFREHGFNNMIFIFKEQGRVKVGTLHHYLQKNEDTFVEITHTPVNKLFANKLKTATHFIVPALFRTNDYPRHFLVNNKIYGLSGRLFSAFMEFMHITVNEIDPSLAGALSFSPTALQFLTSESICEISPYIFTNYADFELLWSYPIEIVEWCIMVPVQSEIAKHWYIIKPFHYEVWILVFVMCFVIGMGLKVISNPSERYHFLEALAFSVNIPGHWTIYHPTFIQVMVYTALYVYGFVISNLYLSLLASFYSSYIEGRQIDTIEDVLTSNLGVLVQNDMVSFLNRTSPVFQKLLIKNINLLQVFPDDFTEYRDALDTRYMYDVCSPFRYLGVHRFATKPS